MYRDHIIITLSLAQVVRSKKSMCKLTLKEERELFVKIENALSENSKNNL